MEPAEWLEYRKTIVQLIQSQADARDRTVLALASGALGLSIAFLHEIVQAPVHTWLIKAGWIFLAVAAIVILASLVTGEEQMRWALKHGDAREAFDTRAPGGWLWHVTRWLNYAGVVSFILGVLFMVVFAFVNF
jgi:hypothetical protein